MYLKDLTDFISMVTDSKDDVLLFIACAVFRATRPLHQRGVMDSRVVASFKDLNKLALTLQTSDSDRSHVGRKQNRGSYASSTECYKCHKMGHRAFECKSNVGSSGRNKLRRLCYKDIAKTTTKYLYYNSGHVCSLHSFIHTVITLEKIVQETQLHLENTDRGAPGRKNTSKNTDRKP